MAEGFTQCEVTGTDRFYHNPDRPVECGVLAEFAAVNDKGEVEYYCRICISRFMRYGSTIRMVIRI